MTMMVDDLKYPDLSPAAGVGVKLYVLAPGPTDEALVTGSDFTIVSTSMLWTDETGHLEVDLTPTDDLTPEGTVYQLQFPSRHRRNASEVTYNPVFTVPAEDEAEHWIGDNLTDPPGALASPALTLHTARTDNPHGVTKAQVGLALVDNTPDTEKPVSTAQAAADAALDGRITVVEDAFAAAASVEDLVIDQYIVGPISATVAHGLFVARFPLEIVAASISVTGNSVLASATNYWVMQLRRNKPDGTGVIVDVYAQRQTSSAAMNNSQDWNFDAVTFNAALRQFAKGDVGTIVFVKNGAAVDLNKVIVTLGYRPL